MKINWICILLILFFSCKEKKYPTDSFWNQFEIIANYEIHNGDSVLICDMNNVKQRAIIPLNLLVEDLQVLKIDNSNDDALISLGARICKTKNYIGAFALGIYPFKLYDKGGRFIRHIGRLGQGPGEYKAICDVVMDEENNRIYFLTMISDKILVYDFEGNSLPSIPMPERIIYGGRLAVDAKDKLLRIANPITPVSVNFVWIQDFNGNIIQKVEKKDYFPEDIMTEDIISTCHTENIDLFPFWGNNSKFYLYHYDISTNRLIPRIMIKNLSDNIFIYELPNHYIAEMAISERDRKDSRSQKVIIEKKTGRGCLLEGFLTPMGFIWDSYGMLSQMSNGYFLWHEFSSDIEVLLSRVKEENISEESNKNLNSLKKIINSGEEDCSLVFMGKFKK